MDQEKWRSGSPYLSRSPFKRGSSKNQTTSHRRLAHRNATLEGVPLKVTILLLAFSLFAPHLLMGENHGVVIAFAGISGSGKTSTAKELATLYPYKCLIEPEERDWPDVIKYRNIFGNFTMWMGFRALWIPQQFQAQNLKKQHQTVFLDSYFIKIIGYELNEMGMDWLFPKEDPYYPCFYQICQLDIEHLPDPDCIVLFDVSYQLWLQLLATRNREWDKTAGFLESYQQTKTAIEHAVLRLCRDRNIKLIHFQPEFGNLTKQAIRLKELLVKEKILPP